MLKKNPEPVIIGWCLDQQIAGAVFEDPAPLISSRKPALSNRSVQACPAVNELEKDLFVIQVPFNLRLRCTMEGGRTDLHVVQKGTRLDRDLITEFVTLNEPDIWRSKNRPVLQIKVPYIFVCDTPCLMTQTPPYMHNSILNWPGNLISGRFPIHLWPRVLNFAFEWDNLEEDLILKRGDPLCYLNFTADAFNCSFKLVEITQTSEFIEFKKQIVATPKFVSNTPSLLNIAERRRPSKLVVPKESK